MAATSVEEVFARLNECFVDPNRGTTDFVEKIMTIVSNETSSTRTKWRNIEDLLNETAMPSRPRANQMLPFVELCLRHDGL